MAFWAFVSGKITVIWVRAKEKAGPRLIFVTSPQIYWPMSDQVWRISAKFGKGFSFEKCIPIIHFPTLTSDSQQYIFISVKNYK